jgi:hypothetical protein
VEITTKNSGIAFAKNQLPEQQKNSVEYARHIIRNWLACHYIQELANLNQAILAFSSKWMIN